MIGKNGDGELSQHLLTTLEDEGEKITSISAAVGPTGPVVFGLGSLGELYIYDFLNTKWAPMKEAATRRVLTM